MKGAFAAEIKFESLLKERGVSVVYPEEISLRDQLEIYVGAETLIFAEGSSQHALELLGFNPQITVIILCRRHQKSGMELPLQSRFHGPYL